MFKHSYQESIGSGLVANGGFGVFDDAIGTAVLSGGTVASVTMNPLSGVNATGTSGDGYYAADTNVTFSAPTSGVTATGTAVLGGGRVISIPLTGAGFGYVNPPAITFSGGGGAGAAAVGVIGPNGTIVAIAITATGSGYTSVPSATIAAAPTGGSNATIGTVVAVFQVASVTITNAGTGYGTTPPRVTFATPSAAVIRTSQTRIKAWGGANTVGPAGTESLSLVYPDINPVVAGNQNWDIGLHSPADIIVLLRANNTTVNLQYSATFTSGK